MSTVTEKILWLDLETSGSDEEEIGAAILEVGFYLTKNAPTFEPLGDVSKVFGLNSVQLEHLPHWHPDVIEMHTKNRLFHEVLRSPVLDYVQRVNLATSVNALIDINPRDKILYGGSGVAHFDRRWIKKFLPEIHDMLTHYALDVGVLRRMFDSAAKSHQPRDFIDGIPVEKPHRALQDAKLAAYQWKYYWEWIHDFGA